MGGEGWGRGGGEGEKEEGRSNVCMCVVQGCNLAATCSSVKMWLAWQVLVWVLASFSRPISVFKLGMTLRSCLLWCSDDIVFPTTS